MGILSKIFKPIKKVFKKIGKGIKSAFKKFGKFMNKLGPLGTIAIGIMMPYLGAALGGAWTGLAGTLTAKGGLLGGVGNFMTKAASFGSAVSGTVSNITGAVTDLLGESVKFVGKSIGLDRVGPAGMKKFFASGGDNLMGMFENVHKNFNKRWGEMSSKWGHFRDQMSLSTKDLNLALEKGTYQPYQDYDQYKGGLKEKIDPTIRAATESTMGDIRKTVAQERKAWLDGVDTDTEVGKFMKDTYDDYEKKLFSTPTNELTESYKFANKPDDFGIGVGGSTIEASKVRFLDPKNTFKTYLNELDPSSPFIKDAQDRYSRMPSAQDLRKIVVDPKEFASAAVDTSDSPYGEFMSGMGEAVSPKNIGKEIPKAAYSYLTAADPVAVDPVNRIDPFYSQPIKQADPAFAIRPLQQTGFNGFFDTTANFMPLPMNQDYQTPGGIYGTTMRSLS